MNKWFRTLAVEGALMPAAACELDERGFVVLSGSVLPEHLERLTSAYDREATSANADDVKTGSTTTRVNDFVNRGQEFDDLYVFPPLLEAYVRVIGRPFKLSALHARTLRPHTPAQELHAQHCARRSRLAQFRRALCARDGHGADASDRRSQRESIVGHQLLALTSYSSCPDWYR
jgi:hypothetical protein